MSFYMKFFILKAFLTEERGELMSIIMDKNKGRLSKGNPVKLSFRDGFKTSTKVQKLRELNKNKHMYVLDFK